MTSPGRIAAPVDECLRVIKGKHKVDILIGLGRRGPLRFGELRRRIPGVSERVLGRQLDELERDGMIVRTVYPEVPPRVEYRLSEVGASLCPILKQLWHWGQHYQGAAPSHGPPSP